MEPSLSRARWLQETRKMRFEETYTDWQEKRLTQAEAARLLGVCERTFRRPRSDQSAGETCAHIPPVTALPRLASDASPASPCMSLRISSSGFPVTSVPGLRMAPCLTPKPDTLRATEPDISFAPNTVSAYN